MTNYHDIAEQMGIPFGFNTKPTIRELELTVERLTKENQTLSLQLHNANAKIQRLINAAEEGEEF